MSRPQSFAYWMLVRTNSCLLFLVTPPWALLLVWGVYVWSFYFYLLFYLVNVFVDKKKSYKKGLRDFCSPTTYYFYSHTMWRYYSIFSMVLELWPIELFLEFNGDFFWNMKGQGIYSVLWHFSKSSIASRAAASCCYCDTALCEQFWICRYDGGRW